MKLLSKQSSASKLKQSNDDLIGTNIRLRNYESAVINRLNTVKDTYEPDKLIKLKEFEQFCKDINLKKSKLLEEVAGIEKLIEEKKEIYFGMITKQDALDEKIFQIKEDEKKLNLREVFVVDLEAKFRQKNV